MEYADEYERRRLPFESPVWDDATLEERRREAAAAPTGNRDSQEAEDGAARKKLLTRKEQVFRSLTILIMTGAFAFVAVIVYSAIVRGVAVVHKDGTMMKQLPAEVRQKITEALEERYPHLDIVAEYGGQPLWPVIIGVE